MSNIKKTVVLKTKMEKNVSEVEMDIYKDGAISFSRIGAEHFIYLYPDVVDRIGRIFIQQLLTKNRRQIKIVEGKI